MKFRALFACAFVFFLLQGFSLFCESSAPIKNTLSLSFVFATTLETKATLTDTISIPLLAGEGALTKDNNLALKFAAEISPVSVNGTFEAVLTPVAFLNFFTGASIGTGWNIPIANGLRFNDPVLDEMGKRTGDSSLKDASFNGFVWSAKAGGTFQFDLGAIVPGDWTHVVFQTTHLAKYRAFSSSSSSRSWLYEADAGENRNGWNYYGSYFLGYLMPLTVDTVGFLLEDDRYLYATKGSSEWGDQLPRLKFGPLINVKISSLFSLAFLVQMQTLRDFTPETKNNTFYQDRKITTAAPGSVHFYRAAVIANYRLR